MKLILTPQQMKSVDEYAIRKLRTPSLRLMENAGKAVVDEVLRRTDPSTRSDKKHLNSLRVTRVLVFCGKGNNGGDGFVVARLLVEKGFAVTVVLIENEKELSGDGLENYQKLQDIKIAKLNVIEFKKFQKLNSRKFDVIVDAMLGTAFREELKGDYLHAVNWCNKQQGMKIAVDIPTGLNGESGEVVSNAFRADITVTMSNPKIGFYRERAKEFTGEVIVADIGIPKKAHSKILSLRGVPMNRRGLLRSNSVGTRNDTILIDESDVKKTFPIRASNSHKHSVGKIFALAGSKGMMGAALLCSQSAMRTGAGQVILGIPDSEYSIVAKRTLEVMPLGLPSTKEGSIAQEAIVEIERRLVWANILLIGCGLSLNNETKKLIRTIIERCAIPMVIDADGLNALVGQLDVLQKRKTKNIVLTPHVGEFSRLMKKSAKEIEKEKFELAASFSKKFNLTLVLKGAPTIIADSKGDIFVNSTGNPGMSTAGSGDVLTGIIASLMAQGNSAIDAAINGVYLHGIAGDTAARKLGMHGMIASDIIRYLPVTIKKIV